MSQTRYDAVIIGGGPGGSTVATLLARGGRRVLVLEKEKFPRFRIGESLLPYNRRIFEDLGVLPALEAAGFVRKFGAQFEIGNRSKALKLVFGNGGYTKEKTAFQVERARFDDLLLRHSEASGAEVREQWTVTRFERSGSCVTVLATGPDGQKHQFETSFLIDAGGRANITGNQERLRVEHPHLRKVAIFGQFEGVGRDSGTAGGDTVIVRLENKWFWFIPLSEKVTSVGCVLDREELRSTGLPAVEAFERIWRSSTALKLRLGSARAINQIHTTTDFSYYNRELASPRLVRVGDAAGFMDPIFSAGVYLAMHSGKLAAELVDRSLRDGHDGSPEVGKYEREVFRSMNLYWEMVEGFYTRRFLEVFLEPRHRFRIPDAITALLAGELQGGWKLYWRRKFFLLLTRLHSRWPLVPGVDFEEKECKPGPETSN